MIRFTRRQDRHRSSPRILRATAETLESRRWLSWEPDPTFGDGGVAGSIVGDASVWSLDMALAPDGDVVVSAEGQVARHNPDGSADTTFGGDGDIGSPLPGIAAVGVQADDKVVTAGRDRSGRFAVARHNRDGSIDTTFGGDGTVEVEFTPPPASATRRSAAGMASSTGSSSARRDPASPARSRAT